MPKGPVPVPALERFHQKYIVAENGCWLWTPKLNTQGYGYFTVGSVLDGSRRTALAYRWSYEEFIGPVPEGKEIDHTCHTDDLLCPGGRACLHRRCVNPGHLEAVDHLTNLRRGSNARKTHCKNGHEYTEANTYRVPSTGYRQCKVCKKLAVDRFTAKALPPC